MPPLSAEFGYYPKPLNLTVGPVRIEPLPGLDQTVAEVEACEDVLRGWIYAPLRHERDLATGEIKTRPFPSRIFALPKTHRLDHVAADGLDHLAFHIWALSFFTGMRLTATEAGFVDATPLAPSKLVDFVPGTAGLEKGVALAEAFWTRHRANPRPPRLVAAAIHALYLAHNPQALQFERFHFLYSSLDACFALAASLHAAPPKLGHAKRIDWMCGLFGMGVPRWADAGSPGGAEATVIRNAAVHEALFMGEPLGFALHGVGTDKNLALEMEALICRFVVALLGAPSAPYVTSSITTRQMHGLDLP